MKLGLGRRGLSFGGSGGPPKPVTDFFNGFELGGSTYSGGPTVVADNTGALVTSPAGVLPIEGMRLDEQLGWKAYIGPDYRLNASLVSSMDAVGWTSSRGFIPAPIETDYYREGSGSIKLYSNNPATNHRIYTNSANLYTSDDDMIIIWAYFPGEYSDVRLKLILAQGSDFTGNRLSAQINQPLTIGASGWVPFHFPVNEMTETGTVDYDLPFENVWVELIASGEANIVAYVDAIFQRPKSKAKVIFTFDDGNSSDYSNAFSKLQSVGMAATSFVVSDRIGTNGYLTVAQMKEMYAAGWDMANHTKSHPNLTTLDEQGVITEIQNCALFLEENDMTRAAYYVAYPGGQFIGAEPYIKAAGTIVGRAGSIGGFDTGTGRYNPLRIPAYILMYQDGDSLATAKEKIDKTISRGQTCVIIGHKVAASGLGAYDWLLSDFEELVDYVADKRDASLLDVETLSGWYEGLNDTEQITPSTPLRTRKGTVSVYGEDFRGTLVEPARTNLALNSGDIGLSARNLEVTIAAGDVSPLGVASKRVTFPLASPGSYVRHTINKDYSSATAIWWLIKPITVPTGAQVRVTGANSYFGVFYDLATMSFVSSFGPVSAHGVVALSGGWYGIYCVGTYNLNGAGGNLLSSTVDNTVIDIAAVQIENGTFPTSYIPTATTTVTRPAANLTRPTAGSGLETGNNFAIYGRVVPIGRHTSAVLFSTYTNDNNYFNVGISNAVIQPNNRIGGVSNALSLSYVHAAGVPFEYLCYKHGGTMGISVRSWNGSAWSAWSAWATNADTQNAPIASTYQIGARNNANHFAANYPFTKIIALNPALNPQTQLADLLSKGRI